MAAFNRYHTNQADANIPFNYEGDSNPWFLVPPQAGDSQNLAYGSFDLCDVDQQPNLLTGAGIRYQNFSTVMPGADAYSDNPGYFPNPATGISMPSPHVMVQTSPPCNPLIDASYHASAWVPPQQSQGVTIVPKCIKCLVQQKSCDLDINGSCTRCSKSAPTEKAWRYCGCIDATITLYRLFDLACHYEVNNILSYAGISPDAAMSGLHQYFPTIYKEFMKPQGLNPVPMSTNFGRPFKIPLNDGDKTVLFKASIKYLKETQENISIARNFIGKSALSRSAVPDMKAVHDFLAIAQERRRAGHDLLRSLSDLVKSVFKGQSKSASSNRHGQLVKARKRVLEGLECLNFILLHGTTSNEVGNLDTAKHLAFVLERLIAILSDKIRKETKSAGPVTYEEDIQAQGYLANIRNL